MPVRLDPAALNAPRIRPAAAGTGPAPVIPARLCLRGGFICLGHTESMSRISPLFEICRYSEAIVYRRPEELRRAR